jgi:DNA processing protein
LLQPSTFLPQADQARRKPEISGVSRPPLDKEYEILLDALGFEPTGVDLLVVRTGLRADEVASMLLILELEGYLLSHPGGLYVRADPRQ